MSTNTQVLSASRAGLGSVVITDTSDGKTQVMSNVGVVQSSPVAVTTAPFTFTIHPFV